jgi:hypothetical protein
MRREGLPTCVCVYVCMYVWREPGKTKQGLLSLDLDDWKDQRVAFAARVGGIINIVVVKVHGAVLFKVLAEEGACVPVHSKQKRIRRKELDVVSVIGRKKGVLQTKRTRTRARTIVVVGHEELVVFHFAFQLATLFPLDQFLFLTNIRRGDFFLFVFFNLVQFRKNIVQIQPRVLALVLAHPAGGEFQYIVIVIVLERDSGLLFGNDDSLRLLLFLGGGGGGGRLDNVGWRHGGGLVSGMLIFRGRRRRRFAIGNVAKGPTLRRGPRGLERDHWSSIGLSR